MKFFDKDTWKATAAAGGSIVSSGYASAREIAESVVVARPASTSYDMLIARITALAFCLYVCAKFIMVIKNRNKKEGD